MGEGSRKCIPALKYWVFYSREKFSHIAKAQDCFLITQKHLWGKLSTCVARTCRNASYLFHTSCGTHFKCCFPVVQFYCVWKDTAFWATSELFRRDGHGQEMVRILSCHQTHLTYLSGQWMTYRNIVLSVLLEHFQNAVFFPPLEMPFPEC